MELNNLKGKTNLPLSNDQKRLWIIQQQDKLNPAYNLVLTYHFNGEINYGIFKKSIDALFKRQHTLFSVFKQKEGVPFIEIKPGPVITELIDFSDKPLESRKSEILGFAGKDSRKPFDIEEGPLYRLYLLKHDEVKYYFHATIHHLIFDGWSMKLFMQNLEKIYNNLIINANATEEPLKFHSYDFATREEKTKEDKNEKKLIKFWKETLKGSPPALKFPFDYPRKNKTSGLGQREPLLICEASTSKLKELSKMCNTSLFKTMLSLLGLLFNKYTGENDICIGFPVSKRREHTSLDEIIGMFVSTSLVRLKINEDSSLIEHVSYTANVASQAIEYSKLPFNKIVEVVNPERRSNINPLFQVALSWWNDVTIPINLNGIRGKRINIPEGVSPFDISFYLWENGDVMEGEIEYSTDVLKHETMLQLKSNFMMLISNLIENPDTPIQQLAMISPEEISMINELNNTGTDYPKEKTIIQLFEDQVILYPDKPAIEFKGEKLSYTELNFRANQLARTLRNIGVLKETPVGILVDKSIEMIVSLLGILKAGGAYLPIDPEHPIQRINFIIKESGCNVLLTQHKYMKVPAKVSNKLDLNSSKTYHKEKDNIENINSSSDLAYFTFTSGTTGVPKGIMIRHYSVVRLVSNVNYMELTPYDRILYTSSVIFDVTTFEIWGALLNGMTLFIVEKETILDPKALGKELIKNKISILHLTSSLFTELAEVRTDIFAGLKYLLVGGDVLSALHINKVRKDIPGLKVLNCYGPSENTTYSTTYLIDRTHDHNIPIGKPVSNSSVYIFDKNLNYQPIGIIGELYVGGDGLSKGYLNRDDRNTNSFIDHPYIPGERLYKTGDCAKWLPDGNIEFHGRIDNQIKINGFRVELEEIESVISDIDGVIESVVKPFKIKGGDLRLIAFLNVKKSINLDSKEIDTQIRKRLPYYMVPSTFNLLNSFPRTINGKIDKKALTFKVRESENKRNGDKRKILTPTQKEIFRIWSKALGTADISVTDNFFDIGGSSLLAISVFSKIELSFNTDLGLRIFFDSPRIIDLAEAIDLKAARELKQESSLKTNNNESRIVNGEI